VQGPKYDMGGVVEIPVFVQQPAFGLQLSKERCARIRRQDVKGRALQPVFFDPARRPFEHIRAILIEAKDEAAG
jgi:hypothetical protein